MREYHEVRRELEGDEAQAYMGPARTLLGALKTQMQRGGLLQGARKLDLPDGTTIKVQSVFGQDKITIIAPAPSQQVAPQEQITVESPLFEGFDATPLKDSDVIVQSIAACGTYQIDDPYFPGLQLTTFPFYWTPGGGKVLIPIPTLAGGTQAISQDGTTVMGSYRNSAAPSTTIAYRWRRGAANTEEIPGGAIGISADGGEVILATGTEGSVYRIRRWTRGGGEVAIAQAVVRQNVPMQTSRDGVYISANVGPADVFQQVAHAWRRTGESYVCPLGPGHLVYDVSNNGIAVTSTLGGVVHLWNLETGGVERLPDGLRDQVSISSDGEHVVGGRRPPEGGLAGAAHIDHQRVIRELPPLYGTGGGTINNFAFSVDAYNGYAVIGGTAAVIGAVNATNHRNDEAIWEYLPEGYRLTRIPVTPVEPLNGHVEGGFLTDVTIARRTFTTDFG